MGFSLIFSLHGVSDDERCRDMGWLVRHYSTQGQSRKIGSLALGSLHRIEIPALPFLITSYFLLTPNVPLPVPVYRDLNTSHQAFPDAASVLSRSDYRGNHLLILKGCLGLNPVFKNRQSAPATEEQA